MRILILFLAAIMASPALAAERVIQRTVPANNDVRFSIDSHRGTVVIESANVDAIEISATVTHDDASVLENVEIEIDDSPSFVAVGVDYNEPPFKLNFGFIGINELEYPDVNFHIIVPEQASLQLKGHRSDFNVQAPAGPVEISSNRGTGRIQNVRNDLEINTERGNFRVEVTSLHNIDIDTSRGSIDLEIANGANFSLLAETNRGELRLSGKDIDIIRKDHRAFINHTEGDGRNRISIDTARGNLRLTFRN